MIKKKQTLNKMNIEGLCFHVKLFQLCPTLCDPMDCSPPGSPVQGILQAGISEWVTMCSSRGSSQSRNQTQVSCDSYSAGWFFTAEPPRKLWGTMLLLLSHFSHVRLCATPETAAYQAPLSLGFSRHKDILYAFWHTDNMESRPRLPPHQKSLTQTR